jgi:hypothetical protein
MEKKFVEGQKGDDITPFDGITLAESALKNQDPDQVKIRIRIHIRIRVKSRIRICIK